MFEYDLERFVGALERVGEAIDALHAHSLPDWLSHRLELVRADCDSLKSEIRKMKGGAI